MTREEEIYEIVDIISPDWCSGKDCKDCYANIYYGNCQYIDRAKCLYDKGYRKQANLLKEFIEWYKKLLKKDHDDKANMKTRCEMQEVEDRYFYDGQCSAISRLITLLDRDLEKFLEEKNGK